MLPPELISAMVRALKPQQDRAHTEHRHAHSRVKEPHLVQRDTQAHHGNRHEKPQCDRHEKAHNGALNPHVFFSRNPDEISSPILLRVRGTLSFIRFV